MSVESLPNPGDPAIRGTVSNEQNKTGDPDLDGWAQLRQIAAASTAMNVTAGQVMADHEHGKLELAVKGSMSPQEYDSAVGDLVAYLQWMGEPAQGQRVKLGMAVLGFLLILTFFAWRLNASYWKDVK